MGDIKVSFGSLEALASDIGNRVSESLRSQISNLEVIWEGGASVGFQTTKNQWNQAADHVKQVLAKIQTAVIQSTDGYRDTEDRNTKRWDA